MKLLKVAAIAAIVFSGSALAGVVPQYGGGGNAGGGREPGAAPARGRHKDEGSRTLCGRANGPEQE